MVRETIAIVSAGVILFRLLKRTVPVRLRGQIYEGETSRMRAAIQRIAGLCHDVGTVIDVGASDGCRAAHTMHDLPACPTVLAEKRIIA